jgi:hypothetical protein
MDGTWMALGWHKPLTEMHIEPSAAAAWRLPPWVEDRPNTSLTTDCLSKIFCNRINCVAMAAR